MRLGSAECGMFRMRNVQVRSAECFSDEKRRKTMNERNTYGLRQPETKDQKIRVGCD
jgi:hypothetical protein